MTQNNSIRPERLLAVLDKIDEIKKENPNGTFETFRSAFMKTRTWLDLNKTEKKSIWSQKDVVNALSKFIQNGKVNNFTITIKDSDDVQRVINLTPSIEKGDDEDIDIIESTTDDKIDKEGISDMFEKNKIDEIMTEEENTGDDINEDNDDDDDEEQTENNDKEEGQQSDSKVFLVSKKRTYDLNEPVEVKIGKDDADNKEMDTKIACLKSKVMILNKEQNTEKDSTTEDKKKESEDKTKKKLEEKIFSGFVDVYKAAGEEVFTKFFILYDKTIKGKPLDTDEAYDIQVLKFATSIEKWANEYKLNDKTLMNYFTALLEASGIKVKHPQLNNNIKPEIIESNKAVDLLKRVCGIKPQINTFRSIQQIANA
jgi:hypothetical protein